MLRMYIVQQTLGLSDEGIEDALYDSHAIRHFVGIDLGRETAPDATTLLKFRHLLEENKLTERIFTAIKAHLAEKGLMLREGIRCTRASNRALAMRSARDTIQSLNGSFPSCVT